MKLLQVPHLFSHTHKSNGYLKLIGNRQDDPALGRALVDMDPHVGEGDHAPLDEDVGGRATNHDPASQRARGRARGDDIRRQLLNNCQFGGAARAGAACFAANNHVTLTYDTSGAITDITLQIEDSS